MAPLLGLSVPSVSNYSLLQRPKQISPEESEFERNTTQMIGLPPAPGPNSQARCCVEGDLHIVNAVPSKMISNVAAQTAV